MAGQRKTSDPNVKQVRKSAMLDEAKLNRARELLGADNDSDVLRRAIDYLLEHYRPTASAHARATAEEE